MPVYGLFPLDYHSEAAKWHSPRSVVELLQAEFDVVEVDADEGASEAGELLARMIAMRAPPSTLKGLEESWTEALRITVYDNDGDWEISFTVIPKDRIILHVAPGTKRAVNRAAKALGYVLEELN